MEIHLFNLTGIDVYENGLRKNNNGRIELDLKGIPSGIYILVVPNGETTDKYKITKL